MTNSQPNQTSDLTQELSEFLRSKLGDQISITDELSRLQGGFDTDTYSFTAANVPTGFPSNLVLRHFRHPGEAPRVVRESTIQNAAAKAGHLVPSVPIDSTGELLGGRPFLIMERLQGMNLASLIFSDQSFVQKFPSIMAKLQAGLHKLDTTSLRKRLTDVGIDVEHMKPSRMVGSVRAIANAGDLRDLTEVSQWLTDNYPTQPENPSIIHGDLHPMNILMHEGKVSGLIDWATSMFTHPEYDIAVSRTILAIGPPQDVGIPKEELDKMLSWAIGEYMTECNSLQSLDESLIDYYAVLRMAHAYAKVLGNRHNIDLPFVAHDGYAWERPDIYEVVTKIIGDTTGIELVSA